MDPMRIENIPKAYLNYILFDENFVPYDFGFDQVSTAARETFTCGNPDDGLPPGSPCPHEKLELTALAQVRGYIYIYLSNESNAITDVYFDDLQINHTGAYVSQATDYGVWGDVLREQKTDESIYRFGYQGQFAEKDEETGWNHFELREYDAVVGRWTSKDPAGQYYSPYVAMGNNPVNGTDPDGGYFFGLFGSTRDQRQNARRDLALYGEDNARINDITSKNISVSYYGNIEWTSRSFGEVPISTTYYNKDGSFKSYDISSYWVTSLATGQVDFDPLTQLTLGFAAVGGVSALGRVSLSTLAADVNYATTYAYVRGSAMIGQGVGYVGARYFYAGYRLFGDKFTRLHPRLFTQTDIGHRAATFLRSDFLRQFPKVSNWNTIYWQTSQGNGYFHIGVNP